MDASFSTPLSQRFSCIYHSVVVCRVVTYCTAVVTVQCRLPPAELDCDLSTYVSIICGKCLLVTQGRVKLT